MWRWLILLLAMAYLPTGVQTLSAQTMVTSPAPDSVSVTIYRDPERGEGSIDAHFPSGFALVTEKRRIALPAGDAVIRFEGVADGMIAVSAVVTGLPGGVVQKNRDARLLSPAALVQGALGKSVHLRRTDRTSGRTTERDAIVRSTPDGALIVETAEGVEALRCSGLPETIIHDKAPLNLSVQPTLSVATTSPDGSVADVMLTYLATGFDWGADYVARIASDGRTLDLFVWLTLANGNGVAFADARLLAIAGKLNRTSDYNALAAPPDMPSLFLQCWPDAYYAADDPYPPPPPPPPLLAMAAPMATQDIMVTARRVATQEDLGDLKLYRVPMAVDINPRAQKQVALLHQPAIVFDTVYTARLSAGGGREGEAGPLNRMIRFDNRRASGAGVPLPSGRLSIFTQRGDASLLLARGKIGDHAVDERVEIDAGPAASRHFSRAMAGDRNSVLLTNAGPGAMAVEIELSDAADSRVTNPSHRLSRRNGLWLWSVAVPANGTARLNYRLRPS